MAKLVFQQLMTALKLLIVMMLLTGLIYPLVITGLAQLFFPRQANGSLIFQNNKIVGSELIGQFFDSPQYFWGRPSATQPVPYNGTASKGSNFGPLNSQLITSVSKRIAYLKKYHSIPSRLVPVDLVTTSASGLDPDISPQAALYQVPRIAKYRKISEEKIFSFVYAHIQDRTFHILGEPRVNVLKLNLDLDQLTN
jgi:K+-transporting ATPase ATPase C chain